MLATSRRRLVFAAAAMLAASSARTQRARVHRIGVLMPSTPAATANLVAALAQGLREQGYIEGRNLALDYRYSDGRMELVAPLAAELVADGVEVIVTTTDAVVGIVARQAVHLPIVMVNVVDPVGTGLVKTLARPGGNVTGLTNLSSEVGGKRVELLKACVPALSRIAYLWNPELAGAASAYREIETAARRLGLHVRSVEVRRAEELEPAFAGLSSEAGALLVQAPNPMLYTNRALIARLAISKRLPSMYNRVEYAAAGGLVSYGPNVPEMFRRASVYVDKILKGARPGDLAVEQPTIFELVINLRTAHDLGIEIPASLLGRADKVLQ
jgi:putative ABC transport system substrate-binding protein